MSKKINQIQPLIDILEQRDPRAYQLLALRRAISLELRGLTRRGRSAYATAKDLYNLTGNRQTVYDTLSEAIDTYFQSTEKTSHEQTRNV